MWTFSSNFPSIANDLIGFLRCLFITLSLLLSITVSAQELPMEKVQVEIEPKFQGQPLQLDSVEYQWQGQPLTIRTLRFYLCNFTFLKSGKVVWREENSFHLIDAEKEGSKSIDLATGSLDFDELQFQLGVDSLTNVSGAFGGDLDPTKGMYWAWNSGYINFKLEGTSPICETRKNAFQYHLGGYMPPYQTVQTVSVKVRPGNKILLNPELDQMLRQLDLSTESTVMSPGLKSQQLSQQAAAMFKTD